MPSNISVIGAGEMGHGIAEVAALNGFSVRITDIKQEFIDRGMERIRASLGKLVKNRRITEAQSAAAIERIRPTLDLREAVRAADVVIEAVLEDLDLKKKLFAEVDGIAPPHAILASNTSGLSITAMGRATKRPDRVVGMHFFNPAVLMPLIEVVKGDDTSAKTVREAEALARAFKKTSVVCRKDVPGFITSRTIAPYMLEAAWIHHEEGIPKEAIDSALRFKVGFPMGPFELADQVGIDLMVYATEKAGLAAPPPMKDLVAAGKFGRKSGEGFYAYVGGGRPTITPDLGKGFDPARILAPVINVAAGLVEDKVANVEEIDEAMRLGTAFPLGPLALGDALGLDAVLAALRGSRRYTPTKILETMVARGDLGEKSGKGFYEHPKEEGAMVYQTILVSRDAESGVATITLNRPDRLNTLTPQLVEELDLACAFRVAAKRAKIGLTEVSLGLIPGAGGIARSVKLLGLARAKELVLQGLRLTADEALAIGLVTQVHENDAFAAAVKVFAEKLAKGPPIALRLAKHVLNRAADVPLEAALEAEAMAFGHVTSTEDIFEGIQAFMEKREPKFKGE